MASPTWTRSVFRVVVGLTTRCSAILVSHLLRMLHTVGFCWSHLFAQIEIEVVVFEVDRYELLSAVPTHQSFEVYPHFPANFAMHKKLETTVRSHIDILMSFTSNSSRTAQNCVYPCESSIHRPAQAIFTVALKLPSSIIKNASTNGRSSPAPSGPKFKGHVIVAAPVSRFIFTHSNRFGLFIAPRQTSQRKVSLRSCHKFRHNLHASQPSFSHHSTRQNSSHHQNRICQCKNCQWIHHCKVLCTLTVLLFRVFKTR